MPDQTKPNPNPPSTGNQPGQQPPPNQGGQPTSPAQTPGQQPPSTTQH